MTVRTVSTLCLAVCLLAWLVATLDAQETAEAPDAVSAEKLRKSLPGVWAFVGDNDEPNTARLKFWGLRHWAVTDTNPDTGEVIFHHGGTYTLEGDIYTETISFAGTSTENMIGQKFRFKITVDGDSYTQLGIGNPYSERRVRLKNE